MIEVNNNIAKLEGSAKQICIEFTHLLVHLIKTFEDDFGLSQEEAISIINECAKIAYMDDEERAEMLELMKEET